MTEPQQDPNDTQAVPDSVRADIAGEPGPADEELRSRALDPNEASVDVADDPNAADVPMAYEDGVAVDPDADEAGDPNAADTGDHAAVAPEEQAEVDTEHPGGTNEPVDVSDVTDDGQVVDVTGEEHEQGGPA